MLIEISLKFVPKGPINNIPALVQIMAWHQPGDKPLSEPMMVRLPTHICVTRPQRVNTVMAAYDLRAESMYISLSICCLTNIRIPIVVVKHYYNCLISTVGFPILVGCLHIEVLVWHILTPTVLIKLSQWQLFHFRVYNDKKKWAKCTFLI